MSLEGRHLRFPLGAQVRLKDLASNPYTMLKDLQKQEPISWIAELGAWFITRRADMLNVLLDSTTFSVASDGSFLNDTLGTTMLSTDGLMQQRLRFPFNGPFSPKRVQSRMAEAIVIQAHHLIDQFIEVGHVDLKAAFADRLALWAVMTILGLPMHDFATIRGWFTNIAHALGNFTHDPQVRQRGHVAAAAFDEYAVLHLNRLKNEPDDSVLAAVIASSDLSEEEILAAARVIIFGGVETTSAMLTNTVWAVLTHPVQYERMCTDPGLLAAAIEESLRWEPPVQSCTRFLTRPMVLHGVQLMPGEMVQCMVGAADRDPEHFVDPEIFNLQRGTARDHLSFATGKHFCLGAALARLEGEVGLRVLFERIPKLRLDPAHPDYPQGHEFRSLPMLHVCWDASE